MDRHDYHVETRLHCVWPVDENNVEVTKWSSALASVLTNHYSFIHGW
ncbi:hypothetical protein QE357_002507 [Siphonobacter sp. BAB-5404]|nr:hypothetical protein [Siphonobacter sp. SORGH_AS_0500]